MLEKHEEIDQRQTLIVNLVQFSESSVDIMIYTFTKTTDWVKFHEIKQDVLLKISDIVVGNGADMAFPSQSIYIENPPTPELAGLVEDKKPKKKNEKTSS